MISPTSTGIQFRQTASVQDDTFSVARLPQYQLLLSLSKSNFLISVIDQTRNKVLVLEEYDLGRIYSAQQAAEQVVLLVGQHKWITAGQWAQIRCEVHQSAYTLIPVSLFDTQKPEAYFNLVGQLDSGSEQLLYYTHTSLDLVVLFNVNMLLSNQIRALQSQARTTIVHGVSAFIEGVLHTQPRASVIRTFILVEPQQATVLLVREGAILFCNSFYFTSPEDFIYYVLLVLQEHQLNPELEPVVIWGEMTPDSALFSILQKYIRHASLGKRPTSLSYSYRLEDFFPHRYFDVYSLALCNG